MELESGRGAFERREWDAAFQALSEADRAERLAAEDLWRLALSAYLTGRAAAFVDGLERAHHGWLEAGAEPEAARCAFWIGLHLAERGDIAQATGWFGRAGRLIERADRDCVEKGYLLLPVALQQMEAGEAGSAAGTAARAAEIGQRFGDTDLHALALHLEGRAKVALGRVDEGLALMDEAMVAVAVDEVSPLVTGLLYCSVIGACRRIYALRRVHEWTSALREWCDRQPDLVAYAGECQVYRAELLQLRGEWQESIAEARRALDRLSAGLAPGAAALAWYQLGEVQRLLGRFAAAEDAYREAGRLGRQPQPGLALLRLAQGDDEAAAAALRRALGETRDPLSRARLLPARVEIATAAGELEAARESCEELEAIARAFGTDVLGTLAAQARGATLLASGRPMDALGPLRIACEGWRALGAPYEAARVRSLLGHACRELGDEDAAELELEAARSTFEALDAQPDLARLDATTGRRGTARRARDHGLTPRQLEVLELLATGRTNRAIAEELFISEKTVARHVADIFARLGVGTRSAATAYAYEHGLLETSG